MRLCTIAPDVYTNGQFATQEQITDTAHICALKFLITFLCAYHSRIIYGPWTSTTPIMVSKAKQVLIY